MKKLDRFTTALLSSPDFIIYLHEYFNGTFCFSDGTASVWYYGHNCELKIVDFLVDTGLSEQMSKLDLSGEDSDVSTSKTLVAKVCLQFTNSTEYTIGRQQSEKVLRFLDIGGMTDIKDQLQKQLVGRIKVNLGGQGLKN